MENDMGGLFGDAGSRRERKREAQPEWVSPEPGMETGLLDGQVIGHVVVGPWGYIAFDADASPLGRFDTLPAAREAAAAAA